MCAVVETGLGHHSIDAIEHQPNSNDLKVALRQADRQQNAIRKTKTWHSERTAFEPPQPQIVPKEKGVRQALRRKLKKKTTSFRPSTAIDSTPPSLFRSDSFDYDDKLKRTPTQVHFTPTFHPRDAQADARTQLLNLKVQHKRRRAEQRVEEKRIKEQEKVERRALVRKLKQEKLLEYVRALTSRHPRKNLKRIRYGPASGQQQYVPLPPNYHQPPVPAKAWYEISNTLSHDLVSPIASPAPQDPISQQRYSYSPASVRHLSDFGSKDELLAHLGGGQEQPKASCHRPQELPAYIERLSVPQQNVEPVEVYTDLPDRELQMCKSKPNLVYCDICSATVCLSGVFYSCTICGPREGGIVCSGCHQENRRCNGGLHSLESSMQVVQRVSPASTWRSQNLPAKDADVYTKPSEPTEDSAALSRINADTASHSLCLATMQKKMTKVEASIETQSKATERLASWLEEAMERQREHAADLTKSMLDEFRAERSMHISTIKRLSTKRKPRRQSSEGSTQLVPMSRDGFRERELALREREMTLQERREAAKERTEKSTPALSPLPSQSLTSAPVQENRLLLGILNKLDRIEGNFAIGPRQAPDLSEKIFQQVVERAMCQLTLVTSGLREHATKRKAESTGASSSIQSTPTTGLSSASFLQPPARSMSRGNQDNDDDDGHSPKRPKHQAKPVPESGNNTILLACPYSKKDYARYSHKNQTELNYRGCSSCVLSDISRLKQHLYRVHQYPEYHCPRCFDDLSNKDRLHGHIRDGCEPRECPYPEKFSDSAKLRKKWPRQPIADSWYKIFKILFPGNRLPASPYAEDLATSGMSIVASNTPLQPLPTLALSPDVISEVVRRQLQHRSITTTDTTQHAFLLSLVQDATTEALGLISAPPTPITNSNPSSAVLHSGTYAASPAADIDPTLLSPGTETMMSTFGTFRNLQDLSSLGSGINGGASLSGPPPTRPIMSSKQSSGTFSGLSPLSGAENLMDSDDDLVQLTSNEIMAPIKPSNSTRTVDSGYGSMLPDCYYTMVGDGVGTGSSGCVNRSADSLLDPETYERLVREHGDDVAMPFEWSLEIGAGVGVVGNAFGQV